MNETYTVKSPELQNRHISIRFSADNNFFLAYGAGNDDLSRSYTSSGSWYKLNDTLVVIKSNSNVLNQDTANVAFVNEKFDEKKFKLYGKRYYFPSLSIDTIQLDKKKNSFVLKQFKFTRTKGKSNYKK